MSELMRPPELSVQTWLNTQSELSLQALHGKVVALFSFQMLCPGCVQHSLPQANRIHAFFDHEDVAVIGLHTVFEHHDANTEAVLSAFLYENRIVFPVGIDMPSTDGSPFPQTMNAYAPTDNLTLMVMGSYNEREMDHVTFQGGAGTNVLGEFTTRSSGFGDTKVAGLIRLHDDGKHKLHLNAGISIPTGSITEDDQILTPKGAITTVRLPYPMQLGSGTWDLEPGITYNGYSSNWGWGAQARASIRLGENSEDYALGDRYEATAWFSYLFSHSLSSSLRIKGVTQDRIDGRDLRIIGPVQTAQTDFQGGDRVDLLWGVNFLAKEGSLKGHRFALEAGFPVFQNLNGPQLETEYTLTGGWQKVF
ncbi:hypothetical protein AB6C61_05820 [Vibrio splendidus]